MTTATTFSRQNNAGLRAGTTYCRENLVLVVVLVLQSKGLYCICKWNMIVRVSVVLNRTVVHVDSDSQYLHSGFLFRTKLTQRVIFHLRW